MEINTTTATIYNVPKRENTESSGDKISLWRLPKVAWACAIIFSVNLLIAGTIAISPELNVDIYGEAAGDVVLAGAKPSPFVEPEPPARPVRAAMKMKPVVELSPEVAAAMDVELANMPVRSASVQIPRPSPAAIPAAYRQPAYVSGSKAYEAAEREMDFPRITASLMPKRTVPATFTGSQEVTPRKVTEREVRPTIIN